MEVSKRLQKKKNGIKTFRFYCVEEFYIFANSVEYFYIMVDKFLNVVADYS